MVVPRVVAHPLPELVVTLHRAPGGALRPTPVLQPVGHPAREADPGDHVPGLRVVDASVFPRIPGYFIVTPTYMVSEKAADDILPGAATSASSSASDWPGHPAPSSLAETRHS